MRAILPIELALLACGCHLVFPHHGSPDAALDAAPCVPGPECWDVKGRFLVAQVPRVESELQIFGERAVVGEPVYAILLDGVSDATYSESVDQDCTLVPGLKRPDAWDIERVSLGGGRFEVRVRGCSQADCTSGKPPRSAGELSINLARGWKVATKECKVSADDGEPWGKVETYCSVDLASGEVSWQAGESCGGCCACADGAIVQIELTVER